MISVDEALGRIAEALSVTPAEQVGVAEAGGRVLAAPVCARVTKPATAVSAMDGYAVRGADVARAPARLRVVGYAPAGGAHDAPLQPGQAVRIFTGAPVPAGADTIVIQENTTASDNHVVVDAATAEGAHVRPRGLDFTAGDELMRPATVLTAPHVALAAAMNAPWLMVRRRPRIAILATGDELVNPGEPLGPNQTISANALALATFVRECGAVPINLGIAPDRDDALRAMAEGARGADLLVTSGGASVGEHDLVRGSLAKSGLTTSFWRIAMRPGKPLLFGRLGETPMLGFPGNPVSTLVCAQIYLRVALRVMNGLPGGHPPLFSATLKSKLGANDGRQDYLRAKLEFDGEGNCSATPFPRQDSSMLGTLAAGDGFVVRAPRAPVAPAGAVVRAMRQVTTLA